jgi:hypothetical protein
MKHFVIHADDGYSSFPCICKTARNLYVSFRHAPVLVDRTHIHYKSRAIISKASTDARSWHCLCSISSPDFSAGVQDPCVSGIKSGELILTYFQWRRPRKSEGVYLIRSSDGGGTWSKPIRLSQKDRQVFSRQSIVESEEKTLLLSAYDSDGCWLFSSYDSGHTWQEPISITQNTNRIEFSEPNLLCLNGGHILCTMRSFDRRTGRSSWIYQAHGWNNGANWQAPVATSMRGLPPSLLALDDGRVLCAYGHRRPPFGIRACLSPDEGITWNTDREFILRSDGADWDVGYPSSVQLDDGRILTVYYIHTKDNPIRRIEGTIWKPPEGGPT